MKQLTLFAASAALLVLVSCDNQVNTSPPREVIEKNNKPQILLAYHGAAMALNAWLVIREELLRVLKIEDHRYIFVDTRTGAPLATAAAGFGAHIDSLLTQFLTTAEQKLAAIDQEILALSKKESDLTSAVNYHDAYTLICDTLKRERNRARIDIERLFSSAKYLGTYTKLVGVGGNSLGEYHQEEKQQHHINLTLFKPGEVGFALMTDEQIESYASDFAQRLARPEQGHRRRMGQGVFKFSRQEAFNHHCNYGCALMFLQG